MKYYSNVPGFRERFNDVLREVQANTAKTVIIISLAQTALLFLILIAIILN